MNGADKSAAAGAAVHLPSFLPSSLVLCCSLINLSSSSSPPPPSFPEKERGGRALTSERGAVSRHFFASKAVQCQLPAGKYGNKLLFLSASSILSLPVVPESQVKLPSTGHPPNPLKEERWCRLFSSSRSRNTFLRQGLQRESRVVEE